MPGWVREWWAGLDRWGRYLVIGGVVLLLALAMFWAVDLAPFAALLGGE